MWQRPSRGAKIWNGNVILFDIRMFFFLSHHFATLYSDYI